MFAFSKQSSATDIKRGSVSVCAEELGVAGDFATPAPTLGRLWSFGIFSEGAAREGGGRSLSFGLSSANGVRCGGLAIGGGCDI